MAEQRTVIDLRKQLQTHENQWVALSLDYRRVLAAGSTLRETRQQAEKTGQPYRFLKVLPFNLVYVPSHR